MQAPGTDTARLIQFNSLYEQVVGDSIDLNEFALDDLYAFRVLQRAQESRVPELRIMASHLEVHREASVESLTIKPLEPLNATWKMETVGEAHPSREAKGWEPNRRTSNRLLSAEEMLIVGRFKRLYQQEFGRQFDIGLFSSNDLYGRAVLWEALGSTNPFLVGLAKRFFDAEGKPKYHRRGYCPSDRHDA